MPASIAAVGMVTSLGLDWKTSCAAARAGIRRAVKLDFSFRTPDKGEKVPAVGHQIGLLTNGFENYARLLRLLAGALLDLRRNLSEHAGKLAGVKCYLSLPHQARNFLCSSLIADEEAREMYRQAEEEACGMADRSEFQHAERLFQEASKLAGWPADSPLAAISSDGHAGVAILLEKAIGELSSGGATAIVLAGVDSLLDEETLAWLLNTQRLKTPAMAAGLMPGEAAAALLLTGDSMPGLARVRTVVRGRDDHPLSSGANSRGVALARAAVQAAGAERKAAVLLSDHNGEHYRAAEFGSLIVRLRRARPWLAGIPVRFPALAFGDTGSASGAVSLGMLASLWSRRQTQISCGIVVSSSDGPERAAVLAERADAGLGWKAS